jgi:hypothetical protein
MIPRRIPVSETCGNGLKDRVTACRKRLRVNRVAQRTSSPSEVGLREQPLPVSHCYELAPAALAFDREGFQLIEQEVGIT